MVKAVGAVRRPRGVGQEPCGQPPGIAKAPNLDRVAGQDRRDGYVPPASKGVLHLDEVLLAGQSMEMAGEDQNRWPVEEFLERRHAPVRIGKMEGGRRLSDHRGHRVQPSFGGRCRSAGRGFVDAHATSPGRRDSITP